MQLLLIVVENTQFLPRGPTFIFVNFFTHGLRLAGQRSWTSSTGEGVGHGNTNLGVTHAKAVVAFVKTTAPSNL